MSSNLTHIYNRSQIFNNNIRTALLYYSDSVNRDHLPALVYSSVSDRWYTNTIKYPYIFISVYDGTKYFKGNILAASDYYTYHTFLLTVIFSFECDNWYINSEETPNHFILCDELV
jgi:hypothetical protein